MTNQFANRAPLLMCALIGTRLRGIDDEHRYLYSQLT
jgi:hypothetical protein